MQPFFLQINNSPDQDWSDGKLNGLWAYSRLNDDQNRYQEFHELLLTTTNATTQKWLLEVYPQMVTAHPAENQRDRFMSQVNKFLQREIQDDVKTEAQTVIEQLKSSSKTAAETS